MALTLVRLPLKGRLGKAQGTLHMNTNTTPSIQNILNDEFQTCIDFRLPTRLTVFLIMMTSCSNALCLVQSPS